MAKATQDETKRKSKGKGAQTTLTWIMTGMLILGLGGFGVTSFTSTQTAVGSVGDTNIKAEDYVRALRQKVDQIGQQFGQAVTVQQAIGFGIDRQALSELVSTATLDEAARQAGLSVGDQTVAAEVMKQKAFIGSTGAFDAATYRETLRRSGWTEADFESGLRRDVSRNLLTGAISGGFVAPDSVSDALLQWVAERRGFSMIRLGAADLAAEPAAPSPEELRAYYDANLAAFTRPQATRIRYVALLPSMIASDQPVDEALLRQIYDQRIGEFVSPERRLVERLVYPDQAALEAAQVKLAAGASFEDLVIDRGLTLMATDMGDVSQDELGAAGTAVFAAALDSVIAAESPLGPALFRVNGSLAGEEVSFDEAKTELAAELQQEEARRLIGDKVEEIDDLLAGGTSLDEIGKLMGMRQGSLDHVAGAQGSDVLEGYAAFREAAAKVKQGDFPEAVLLDDGGIVAIEFAEIVPPTPIAFEEAEETVAARLESESLRKALSDRALALKSEAEAGAPLASLAIVDVTRAITRDGTVKDTPPSLLSAVFDMKPDEIRIIEEGDFIALLRLDTVTAADPATDEIATLKTALAAQLEQAFAQDAVLAFTEATSLKAGITIDQTAINTINSSLQ